MPGCGLLLSLSSWVPVLPGSRCHQWEDPLSWGVSAQTHEAGGEGQLAVVVGRGGWQVWLAGVVGRGGWQGGWQVWLAGPRVPCHQPGTPGFSPCLTRPLVASPPSPPTCPSCAFSPGPSPLVPSLEQHVHPSAAVTSVAVSSELPRTAPAARGGRWGGRAGRCEAWCLLLWAEGDRG